MSELRQRWLEKSQSSLLGGVKIWQAPVNLPGRDCTIFSELGLWQAQHTVLKKVT